MAGAVLCSSQSSFRKEAKKTLFEGIFWLMFYFLIFPDYVYSGVKRVLKNLKIDLKILKIGLQ